MTSPIRTIYYQADSGTDDKSFETQWSFNPHTLTEADAFRIRREASAARTELAMICDYLDAWLEPIIKRKATEARAEAWRNGE